MKSGGSTQVKQLAYQLTVTNKHDGRSTGWSDHTLVRKQKNITLMSFKANDNKHNHGVLSASVLIRYKVMTSDRKKVIILTLSCLLTKMASRGHMSRVKPYSRGTGASKKGEMDPPYSVLIYWNRRPPCTAQVCILSHTVTLNHAQEVKKQRIQQNTIKLL